MEMFQGKYRIPTNRLHGHDYGSHGWYFVTICTQNREHYFGKIIEEPHHCAAQNDQSLHTFPVNDNNIHTQIDTRNCAYLQATDIGKIAIDYWMEIPRHYPFVELDAFVVMPDHIHGLLFFNRPDKSDWVENQFGVQSQNLGAVIRAYKSSVKRYANQNGIQFAWQSRYHDSIIRDENTIDAIRQYIRNNPTRWLKNDSDVFG